jgi:hypothetical protein
MNTRRTDDGEREALRVYTIAGAGAVRAGAAAINELTALVVATGDDLRAELCHVSGARRLWETWVWVRVGSGRRGR